MIRKDNKGRVLRDYEYQRDDGIYYYIYYDSDGKPHREYSQKLEKNDKTRRNLKDTMSLREKEEYIINDRIEELHKLTRNKNPKKEYKSRKKIDTTGLYKRDIVIILLNISDKTFENWYLFKSKHPNNKYAQMIPAPKQFEKRGTRYWTESDILSLQRFKQVIPKGRLGLKNSD